MPPNADEPAVRKGGLAARMERISGSKRLSRILGIALMSMAVLAGFGTYAAFTGVPPLGGDADTLVIMVYVDLVIMLLLGFIVARRIVALWSERRRGSAGSRLHVRLVALFAALSVTPAIIVSTFSLLFFDLGIESWFSERVRTAVNESRAVAEAYLVEHRNNIRADALRMARDLNRDARQLQINPPLFNRTLEIQRRVRELSEAIVFQGTTREVLARAGLTIVLEFEPIDSRDLLAASNGEIVVLTGGADDRVRALLKLDAFADMYLYIGRLVDPQVLSRIEQVRGAAAQFERLETQRVDIQLSFALAFVVVALLLLLSAIWIGLTLATQLTAPISALIGATEQVRAGDLDARVSEIAGEDELALLSRAFNRMTSQLRSQHNELMEANRQDRRPPPVLGSGPVRRQRGRAGSGPERAHRSAEPAGQRVAGHGSACPDRRKTDGHSAGTAGTHGTGAQLDTGAPRGGPNPSDRAGRDPDPVRAHRDRTGGGAGAGLCRDL